MKKLLYFLMLLEAAYAVSFKGLLGPELHVFAGYPASQRLFSYIFISFSVFMACLALMEALGYRRVSARILYVALGYALILLCFSLDKSSWNLAAHDSLCILASVSFMHLFVLSVYWTVKEDNRIETERMDRRHAIALALDDDHTNPLRGVRATDYLYQF